MPKNYNKKEALPHMRKIQSVSLMAQDLAYSGIRDLARNFNVSTQQLYQDFHKHYGFKYTEGLDKYEMLLRKKEKTNLKNQGK